jgi:hypothetical protein
MRIRYKYITFIIMKICDECNTPHENNKIQQCMVCNVHVCPSCTEFCTYCKKGVCVACVHDGVDFLKSVVVITFTPQKKILTRNRCYLCRK